ncbi:MAG: helix-turn-helix transcriptional regulator [Candidatus Limivicinus sp.]
MYDKTRCLNNIYALAKERGIRIGDLEESAGVSKGYLSRVAKPDYQGSPSIEMLDAVAQQLGVGIDFLVNFSPDAFSESEQFVMRFIDKLATQTAAGKLEWLYETEATLTAEDDSRVDNPLVRPVRKYSEERKQQRDTHEYSSAIYEKAATVSGTCYHAKLPNTQAQVWLNKVTYHGTPRNAFLENVTRDIIEVYLTDPKVQPICSTYYVSEELKNAVNALYLQAVSSPSRIALPRTVRSTMDAFLKA